MRNSIVCAVVLLVCLSELRAQEVGLQLYSLRNQFEQNVDKTFNIVENWGIRYVEGAGVYHDLDPDAYIKKLKSFNLKLVSMAADYNELKSAPERVVERAEALGVKYVVCFWIPHEGDFALQNVNEAAGVFNNVGKLLKEQGISFCYHIHGYEFQPYKNGTLLDELAGQMNEQFANFEMDVFWTYHGGADPVQLMNKYPGRFPLLHLKDMQQGTAHSLTGHADVESNVVLGDGVIDIASIVKEAKKHGVTYMFIEDESSRVVEQVPLSLKYLKSLR